MGVAKSLRHGMTDTPIYSTWEGMIQRTTNPRFKFWSYYGGRGITVCEEWRDFRNFYQDMGDKPSPVHSLNRIDNDGNYEPGNVAWATRRQQSANQRPRRRQRGAKGVSFSPRLLKKPWRASIYVDKRSHHLGWYATEVEAQSVYQYCRDRVDILKGVDHR